jgi:hypothetical protein
MKFVARLSGDRYCASLCGMFELSMTAALPHFLPPVVTQHPQDVANLHREIPY